VQLVESTLQKRNLEIIAATGKVFRPERLMGLQDLIIRVFSDARTRPFEIRGTSGVFAMDGKDFSVNEKSSVETPEGYLFEVANVSYNAREEKLRSSDPVKIFPKFLARDTPGFLIQGRGLEMNLQEKQYEVLQNVQARQRLGQKNQLQIQSNSLQMNPSKNESRFQGRVTVQGTNFEMKGQRLTLSTSSEPATGELRVKELRLDRGDRRSRIRASLPNLELEARAFTMQLSQDGSPGRSSTEGETTAEAKGGVKLASDNLVSEMRNGQQVIELSGNVRILLDQRTAQSDRAEYYPENGNFVLRSVASVIRGDERIEGELIRFSTKNS
jgi:lipopolysaccharide export system protein LptA